MANDIGSFFASEPDPNVAATSIYQHIKRYWEPRMRARMVAYFNETGGAGLEGAAKAAVQRLVAETAAKA
jgi:formate dehydrogenase subunit delta